MPAILGAAARDGATLPATGGGSAVEDVLRDLASRRFDVFAYYRLALAAAVAARAPVH